jgi:hypothetical protein
MKHLKINMKLRQFLWITEFFQIFKIIPFCVVLNHNEPGPKGPMPLGKGLKESASPDKMKYFAQAITFLLYIEQPPLLWKVN